MTTFEQVFVCTIKKFEVVDLREELALRLSQTDIWAAFAITYGAIRDFHPEMPADSPWAWRAADALRTVMQGELLQAKLHETLERLVTTLGDTGTRMLPLLVAPHPYAAIDRSRQPITHTVEGDSLRIQIQLDLTDPRKLEPELRKLLGLSFSRVELVLQGGKAMPVHPDWRTRESWATVRQLAQVADVGEVLCRLFGCGECRSALVARQHVGMQQTGVDPIRNADVRQLLGRYQSGHFLWSRPRRTPAVPAFTGPLTIKGPKDIFPWLEPVLADFASRPATSLEVEQGEAWSPYGHQVDLPAQLSLEVRRWALFPIVETRAAAQSDSGLEPDRQCKQIASLLTIHHAIRTFNPYFDPQKDDQAWADALSAIGQRVLDAGDAGLPEADYYIACSDLVAHFPGGHTWAGRFMPFLPGDWVPEVFLDYTAEGVVVVSHAPPDSPLQPGDLILAVDEEAATKRLERFVHGLRLYPHDTAHFYAARVLLAGPQDCPARIEVERFDGESFTVEMPRTVRTHEVSVGHPFKTAEPVRMIEVDDIPIRYIDLAEEPAANLDANLDYLEDRLAVILDMRGYPQSGIPDLSRFFPLGGQYRLITRRPVLDRPLGWKRPRTGWLEDITEYVDQTRAGRDHRPVAVLCGGGTASDAELVVDLLRATGNALVVGTGTKGAAGAPVWTSLPGGGRLQFSGSLAFQAGRPPVEGVGIQPDVECLPTRAGLAKGQDEVLLEAASRLSEIVWNSLGSGQ